MARKKQPAVLKQYQLCGNRQGDQSVMQSNKEKQQERKFNAEMRGGRRGKRDGAKVGRIFKIYLFFLGYLRV